MSQVPLPLTLTATGGWLNRISDGLVLAALATISVSSAVFLPLPTSVRPLTPLLALSALILLIVARRIAWRPVLEERSFQLLVLFSLFSLLVTVLALVSGGMPVLKGVTPLVGALKGFISLALGIVVYVTIRVALCDRTRLRRGEVAIAIGMAVCVFAALIQVFATTGSEWAMNVTVWLTKVITVQINMEGYLSEGRVWGLAYEPSWMASALGVALLPIAVTRALCEGGVVPWMTTALAFLGIGLSTSRGGLLLVFIVILIVFVWCCLPVARGLSRDCRVRSCLLLTLFAVVMVGIANRSVIVRKLIEPTVHAQSDIMKKMNSAGLNFRVASAQAAWETWLERPIFGVGIGLSPWSIVERFPSWSLEAKDRREALLAIDRTAGPLPNPKNFFLRLLAETGIIGTAIYVSFLWCHRPVWTGRRLSASLLPLLALAVVMADWLTLDSFALAGSWVALGWAALESRGANEPEVVV